MIDPAAPDTEVVRCRAAPGEQRIMAYDAILSKMKSIGSFPLNMPVSYLKLVDGPAGAVFDFPKGAVGEQSEVVFRGIPEARIGKRRVAVLVRGGSPGLEISAIPPIAAGDLENLGIVRMKPKVAVRLQRFQKVPPKRG